MRKGYIILACFLVVAAALWIVRRPGDHVQTNAFTAAPSGNQRRLPDTREEVVPSPPAVALNQPEATPPSREAPDAKLIAAKKHLPWASDESLRMLIKGGVNIENIERGRSRIGNDLVQLKVAVNQYRELTGEYPEGGNVEFAKALLGENPKKQVFIDWPKKQIGQAGELLDPWGTPYEMRVVDDVFEIRSAGPDLLFGTADDKMSKP